MSIPQEVVQEADKAKDALELANSFPMANQEDYEAGARELHLIKSQKNSLDAQRKLLKDPINKAAKQIEDFFRAPIAFLGQAEQIIKKKMISYAQEQERIRHEAERKRREEEDRLRLEAEAKALEAMEQGDDTRADEILEQAEMAPPPAVYTPPPAKAQGISQRDNWKAELTDMKALARAVADGKAPVTLLQLNSVVAGQMARSLKDAMSYPGVRFYNDPTIAARAV